VSGEGLPDVRLGPGEEFDLIRELLGRRAPSPGVSVGPGDDGAVLEGGLVVSVDLSVEDVHFRRDWLPPRAVGYRAAMAGLSDLAAMAARPLGVLVAYALPEDRPREVALELHAGVDEACRAVGAPVLGGDVTRSPGPLVIDVVSLGRAERPLLRRGARPGDEVWVTGRLGGAAAAVRLLTEGREPPAELEERYASPRARVSEALWLAETVGPSALIDLSDGLVGDAAHVAAASGVTLTLDVSAVPVEEGIRGAWEEREALELAVAGGEDYELMLTAATGAVPAVVESFETTFGVPLTRIGRVGEQGGHPVLIEWPDGSVTPPEVRAFDHLAGPTEASGGAEGGP
jgi:thiamine-monophosphate kinase